MSQIYIPPANEQIDVLCRGTVDLQTRAELEQRLRRSHERQQPLVVKTGFDPTAADLHFGHTVLIEKMAQFQRFGHDVVFLVGDFTAMIGDPTGRNALRPTLTPEQVQEFASTYTRQCFRILDHERTRIEWNSRWLNELDLRQLIELTSRVNLARLMERRDFKNRWETGVQIAMHELLYPLVQGYDSVALKADVELGGHDQIFNLLVGRQLQSSYQQVPQVVLTVTLLLGTDGLEKMSKSSGNHVGITEPPQTMFGKVMSVSDETMRQWYPLLTGTEATADEPDPLHRKKSLAHEMVRRFHGVSAADDTLRWWNAGRPPVDIVSIETEAAPLYQLIRAIGAAKSGGEARRKVCQGGVRVDGTRIDDPAVTLEPGCYLVQVGKKWAAQVTVVSSD